MKRLPRFRPSRVFNSLFVLIVLGASSTGWAHDPQAAGPITPTETPEQWIALAKRVHGGFGSYLPLGIRIGIDARQRLDAGPRDLDVTYFDGPDAPCACVADGLMLATGATMGQGSLHLAPTKSAAGTFGVALIRHKTSGKAVRYTMPAPVRPLLDDLNKRADERGRFDGVMALSDAKVFDIQMEDGPPALDEPAPQSQPNQPHAEMKHR